LEDKCCTNYAEEANIYPLERSPNAFSMSCMMDEDKIGSGQNSSQGFVTAWVEDMFGRAIGTAVEEGRELS
jgi:hypothetical protein